MTGPGLGDRLRPFGQPDAVRMSGSHPLTAGLSGVVTVGTAAASFSWGKPGAAAIVRDPARGNSSRATIFAYEAGAPRQWHCPRRRAGGPVPERRRHRPWNANGRSLFATAVQWARGRVPPPANRAHPPVGRFHHPGPDRSLVLSARPGSRVDRRRLLLQLRGHGERASSGPGAPLVDRDHEGHSGFGPTRSAPDSRTGCRATITTGHWSMSARTTCYRARAFPPRARNLQDHRRVARRQPERRDPAGAGDPEPCRRTRLRSRRSTTKSRRLRRRKTRPASPVIVVDQYSGYSTLHPELRPDPPERRGRGDDGGALVRRRCCLGSLIPAGSDLREPQIPRPAIAEGHGSKSLRSCPTDFTRRVVPYLPQKCG